MYKTKNNNIKKCMSYTLDEIKEEFIGKKRKLKRKRYEAELLKELSKFHKKHKTHT